MAIEIEITDINIWDALTEDCPNLEAEPDWKQYSHICELCEHGRVLTDTDKKLARLFRMLPS